MATIHFDPGSSSGRDMYTWWEKEFSQCCHRILPMKCNKLAVKIIFKGPFIILIDLL